MSQFGNFATGGGRGGRGSFNHDSSAEGAGFGSGGGGRGGTFSGRGSFGQDIAGDAADFGSSNRGGRGAMSGQGGFSQNTAGHENSNFSSSNRRGGRGAFGISQGSFGQNTAGYENSNFSSSNRGGGRGAFGNSQGSFGQDNAGDAAHVGSSNRGGRGAMSGQGGFSQNTAGQENSNIGSSNRGGGRGAFSGQGGFSQNTSGDAHENSDFSSSNRGGGRGAFGYSQGSFGQNTAGHENSNFSSSNRGGGRGAFGNSQGSFGQNTAGDTADFGSSNRGGRGAMSGPGGFSQNTAGQENSNIGSSNRGGGSGAFGNGQGNFNQNGAQVSSECASNHGGNNEFGGHTAGGFGNAPAVNCEQPQQRNPNDVRTPMNYVPHARNVNELFSEDQKAATDYADVVDHDDDVVIENFDGPVFRMQKWEEVELEPQLLTNIKERSKYTRPRKIQSATIPFVLDKFDIKSQAETGSGKTAAFVIPIIDSCMRAKLGKNEQQYESEIAAPFAIIIGPTRELVMQVFEQAEKFAANTGVSVAKAYGKYNISRNHHEIRNGCDILVATPGRLNQFIKSGEVQVKNLRFLVLDEADRLLDEHFSVDIMDIVGVEGFPPKEKRQTLLFSATFSDDVMSAADQLLKPDAVFITNHRNNANKRIKQDFVVAGSQEKLDKLAELLNAEAEKVGEIAKMRRTLVFVNTKRMSDLAALFLCQHGIPASSINGDRGQHLREQALAEFRSHKVAVLCATDVCARGIDVKELDHVINMEVPTDRVTYVHRIGRCGRIAQGYSTTFIEGPEPLLGEIAAMLRENNEEIPEALKSVLDQSGGGASALGQSQNFAPTSSVVNNVPASGEAVAAAPHTAPIDDGW